MTIGDLLAELETAGVELRVEGDRLLYDAPAGAMTAELKATLRSRKPELLSVLAPRRHEAPALPAVDAPLSFAQQSLWFLHELYPGDTSASEQFAIRLDGPLAIEALSRAWNALLERHAILRTTFGRVDGQLRQTAGPVPAVDWSVEPLDDAGLLRVAEEALRTPFDPETGPLLRPRLLHLRQSEEAPAAYLLLVTAHHLIADGLSVPLIRDELAALYELAVAGEAPRLPSPRLQYAALARAEQAAGEDGAGRATLSAGIDYWRRRLGDEPPSPLTELVRPAGIMADTAGSRRLPFELDAPLAAEVRRLARECRATPFMVLLAAFRLLIARCTGRDDFVIGTPLTLRDDAERRQLIGCLVNPVALRTAVDVDLPFRELVRRERDTVLGALEHRAVPFARVVEAVRPERRLGEHPLFRILFSCDPGSVPVTAAGVEFAIVSVPAARASYFDLECSLQEVVGEVGPQPEKGGGFRGHFAWSVACIESWVAERLPERFTTLLRAALADPDRRAATLPLMGPAERAVVLDDWNAAAAVSPPEADATLQRLFLEQAARLPDADAVRAAGVTWSYGELAARSGRIARALLARGVRSGDRVGLALGRSPELVAALIGVLRAGGVAVPLDPEYPPARLDYIAADAGLALLIGGRGLRLPGAVEVGALMTGANADADLLPAAGSAGDPAIILYTSGSTGQPKGAVTLQRNAVNRCRWMEHVYGIGADDVFSLRTSSNFIDSLWEIFGALSTGAPLVVVPDDVAGDPLRLPDHLATNGVTHLVLVPSLLRALLDVAPDLGARLPALRSCIVSGEPLPVSLARRFRASAPAVTLFNTYGTSEIWDATCQVVAPDGDAVFPEGGLPESGLSQSGMYVPIGRPIANVRAYVLDARGEPVPPGVPGELAVGGIGIGPGYWRRPELTDEKFIAHPFAGNGRLYRTGDRARHLADGTLECLGRLDAQLKLRGFRIEAAEVEAAIALHPGVVEAAVRASTRDPSQDGTAELVAHVVRRTAGEPGPAALREHLRSRLPGYMIPATWVFPESLPRTPSGKLDRRSLPEPPAAPAAPAESAAAFTHATEGRLAELWAEVLGRPVRSSADDFFDLGGHSLLAVRLVTRMRAAFGTDVGLRDVFEHPTLRQLAAVVDGRLASVRPPIVPVPRDGELPLSFSQERLWFLDQLDPGSAAGNIAWSLQLAGPLDHAVLEAAVAFVVARHEPLRTRFPATGGRPRQVIETSLAVPVETIDVAAGGETTERLRRLARQPFDLATGPLLRLTLLRHSPVSHRLLLVIHHIISDATSNHVFVDELLAAYAAFVAGRMPDAAPLPVQYADHASWQRRHLQGGWAGRELDWWRARLGGAPPLLELPADRPRPAEQQFRGAWVWRTVPAELAGRLAALARQHGCTPFVLLLAAFKVLLHRLSGSDDIVVGTPVEGRLEREVEGLIGLFINTLVLRTDLSGEPTFAELLERVRTMAVDAQAHQEIPFERLVEALGPERSLSRAPLFQVMFNLIRMPARRRRVGELEVALDRLVDQGIASFDLTLTVGEHDEGLELIFEYATDLFDVATAEMFADGYGTLLRALVDAGTGQPVSRLPLLAPEARAALLGAAAGSVPAATGVGGDFSGGMTTGGAAAVFRPVHDVVATQAARRPHVPAVVLGDDGLDYDELDRRANRLANYLLRVPAVLAGRGSSDGFRVGICLPRSPGYLVAVLAVLKAGAAYVPLDTDYPAARFARMAKDARLALLLTDAGSSPGLTAEDLTSAVIRLDEAADAIAAEAGDAPVIDVTPDMPAYVLYTSGSTGMPKGVVVTHGNLAAMLVAWREAYALEPGEAHLQMASAAFDVFTGDWVRALGSGGTLVICPKTTLLDPPALCALLAGARIRVAEFVPAVIRNLLAGDASPEKAGEALAGLRLLIVGSDVWYADEYRALKALRNPAGGPATRVVNSYGVAEATIDSSWFEETPERPLPDSGPVPIGRPFAGTTLHVLDRNLEPVPPGVPGEICIGGAGVASGYFGDPALTAERFVADPFISGTFTPGARLYRSGDGGRRRRDGTVELLGRLDGQIKLRGFRIEPGEIEAALRELPEVAEAVVLLRDGRLVAWVVPAEGRAADYESVRRALVKRLPDYMLPSALVSVASLPLMPNGKIDRAALPEPEARAGGTAHGGPPRTPLEDALCGLMAEALELPAVGIADDFFALGGHSLLATRLVSRIRDALRVELPLRAIFEGPTVAGLAVAVGEMARRSAFRRDSDLRIGRRREEEIAPEGAPASRGAMRARPQTKTAPLSLPQQRLWFLDRLQPGNTTWHVHTVLRLRGELDVAAMQKAFAVLVARHEPLRTRFVERDGVGVQIVDPPDATTTGVELIPVTDRSTLDAAIAACLAAPFDLARGPLLRATLLASGMEEHVLVLVLHHIVADGWSFGVLSRELSLAYAAALRGEAPAFAPLPVQYADYALWQRDRLATAEHARQLDYWRRQLGGAPPVLELCPDLPRPAQPSGRGTWLSRRLDGGLPGALHALARAEGCTLYMVLLAAFDVLLARYGGTEDVVVGTPVAGRGRSELEGLIGFFVNTLVLRTGLAGNPDFRTLLARVKDVTLDAYANADVPFEQLVETLRPQRSLSHAPLVQVQFVLHNQPRQPLQLPGVTTEIVQTAGEAMKYDLGVHVAEEADGLHIAIAYSLDLFTPSWAERFAEDFEAVLRAAVRDPSERLSTLGLPCRSGASRDSSHPAAREIAAGAAPTGGMEAGEEVASHAAPITGGLTLPLAFAAVAAAQPSRPAVSVPGTVWTYAELAAEAARIAAALTATDTGSRIGLWFRHGAGQVAAMLGVLTAGKAFVPLDPLAPPARLEALMRATGLRTVVTERASVEASAWLQDRRATAGLRLVIRDELPPASPLDAVTPLDTLPADPDAVAYVLGTSGSTGEPKRVSQTHRNVLHLVGAWSAKLGLTAEDRLSLLSTYGYDAAVQDVFGALLTGAELHPLDVRGLDRDALLDRIASAGITVLHATPTVYRHLFGGHVACRQGEAHSAERPDRDVRAGGTDSAEAAAGMPGTFPDLRLVVLGGETARRSDLELFRSRFRRGARLVNGYGLTEATAVLQYFADHDSRPYGLQLPIGDPEHGVVGGQQVLLLDEAGEPAGVTGELALVSRYRSPGYGPTTTAPEAGTAEGTVWRTGDLARRLPDGTLAWTGRRDRQLKLGGIRIEPGEVEAALLAQPGIDEAAVLLDTTGVTPLLVAYVAGAGVPPVDEIRSGMKSRLPAALVPSRYAVLETLPKRPNGKVDRGALPPVAAGFSRDRRIAPVGARFSGDPASVAAEAGACRGGDEPPAGVAGVVARVWSELLGLDAIGAEDDFFALGGHSLLAMRLIARLRERLGVELPLIAVFERPTVAGMAAAILAAGAGVGGDGPGPKRGALASIPRLARRGTPSE